MWEIPHMVKHAKEPQDMSWLIALLDRAKPAELSHRQWLLQSGVNTSFMTDLSRGVVPGIDKIYRLASRAGLSLSEFFDGHPAACDIFPSVETLTSMLEGVQRELPATASYADWPRLAASALHTRLERYRDDAAKSALLGPEPVIAPEEDAQSHPTNS